MTVVVMDEVKRILSEEIDKINREEKRGDNKIRFSRKFMQSHPYLFSTMLISYIPVAAILLYAPYFGWYYAVGFTVFVLVMVLALSLDIRPKFRFEDIDVHDLRICYNGGWFTTRHMSPAAVDKLLNNEHVPPDVKTGIDRILHHKGAVVFYDVFSLAYRQPPPA
ncbi:hypothetical protein EH206_07150 [Brenneria nigrifluens DSM 30175 = ATCC 13028]|uniref:Inner membrane protein YlaC n=2 Tax=Pectobacteriaceae TaxID=1903410 RepID=A0A2U1UPW8_9GAMM|nr:hypothetical protein DDT54_13605 [Brenneria nigrifluens DSM 30175 = ATCC 13028]QCR06861.1 hypothetical protein EH206_07150 [Brenneria nigrifluens DSM 30175 = ATCC 13028]